MNSKQGKFPHTAVSSHIKCIDCKKPIKLNLIRKKYGPTRQANAANLRCYDCHCKANPHMNAKAGWRDRLGLKNGKTTK